MTLLQHWGIEDEQNSAYYIATLHDPRQALVKRPPDKILQLHLLVRFFENHGIDLNPAPTILLLNLPPVDRRFGNAANWGDYILSLPEPEPVLRQLIDYEFHSYYGDAWEGLFAPLNN